MRQPWASLIVHGIKDVENRNWPIRQRGYIMIHASRKRDRSPEALKAEKLLGDRKQPTGCLLGMVEVVACVHTQVRWWRSRKWFNSRFKYHWLLRCGSVLLSEQKPMRGRLGLYDLPANEESEPES